MAATGAQIQGPGMLYSIVPEAGFFYQSGAFRTKLGYKRMDFDLYNYQKGWISLSFSFLINRKLNVFHPKEIDGR
ncbi:MAG: hypothetical protein HC906_15155 [Bacteroidales bacterium]|nr:hypothetical protein [Bacteroidales bacterium]